MERVHDHAVIDYFRTAVPYQKYTISSLFIRRYMQNLCQYSEVCNILGTTLAKWYTLDLIFLGTNNNYWTEHRPCYSSNQAISPIPFSTFWKQKRHWIFITLHSYLPSSWTLECQRQTRQSTSNKASLLPWGGQQGHYSQGVSRLYGQAEADLFFHFFKATWRSNKVIENYVCILKRKKKKEKKICCTIKT